MVSERTEEPAQPDQEPEAAVQVRQREAAAQGKPPQTNWCSSHAAFLHI